MMDDMTDLAPEGDRDRILRLIRVRIPELFDADLSCLATARPDLDATRRAWRAKSST